jgi:hypothetical protein
MLRGDLQIKKGSNALEEEDAQKLNQIESVGG